MSERLALIGIFAIVIVSVFAVVYVDSITGNIAGNAYGGSKMYGGMLKKVNKNPAVLGRAYEQKVLLERAQAYLYNNKDKWDCSYGSEALQSEFPCVLEETTGKYCCVIPEDPTKFGYLKPDASP